MLGLARRAGAARAAGLLTGRRALGAAEAGGGLLLVARHGERADRADPRWAATAGYPLDPPLSESGCADAERMVMGLRERGIAVHHIFSSPLRRCLQTAQIAALTAGPDAVFRVEVGLQEAPYKLWPHLASGGGAIGVEADLKAVGIVDDMPRVVADFSRLDPTYPSQFDLTTSERSAEETADRAGRVLRKLRATFPSGNILVVTHSSFVGGGVRSLSPGGARRHGAALDGVPPCGVVALRPPEGGGTAGEFTIESVPARK